jgi:hypothetical protein
MTLTLLQSISRFKELEKSISFRALLACTLLITLVIGRLFTETLGVIPEWFNFIDLILLALYSILFCVTIFRKPGVPFYHAGLMIPLLLFLGVFIVSVLMNNCLHAYSFLPAIADFIFYFEPIAFALFFLNLGWCKRDTQWLAYCFVILGILQIPIGFVQILSIFSMKTETADFISGTFGLNGSQMDFFLILVIGFLIGRYLVDQRARWLLPVPLMIFLFYANGFKAMWLSFPASIIFVVWCFHRSRWRQKIIVSVIIFGFSIASALSVGKLTSSSTIKNWTLVSAPMELMGIEQTGKVKAISNLIGIYRESPPAIIIGVGPGAYSSRGYQTFINPTGNISASNVTKNYVSTVEPSYWAEKYALPLIHTSTFYFLGSGTVDWPFSSYLTLVAELGILGIGFYFWIYIRVFKIIDRESKKAWHAKDALAYAISMAGLMGIVFLAQIAILDNWLESVRVMIPFWLMVLPLLPGDDAKVNGYNQAIQQ